MLECNIQAMTPLLLGLCRFLLQLQVILTSSKATRIKFPSKFLSTEL